MNFKIKIFVKLIVIKQIYNFKITYNSHSALVDCQEMKSITSEVFC
jgi:hypothetical protein